MTKTDLVNLALSKLGDTLIGNIADPNSKPARIASIHYPQALKEVMRAHFWNFATRTVDLEQQVAGSSYQRLLSGGTKPVSINGYYAPTGDYNGRPTYLKTTGGLTKPYIRWNSQNWEIAYNDGSSAPFFSGVGNVAAPELSTSWTILDPSVGGGSLKITVPVFDTERSGWMSSFALPSDFLKLATVEFPDAGRIDRFELQRVNQVPALLVNATAVRITYVQLVDDPNEYDPMFIAAFVTLLASKMARSITGSDAMEGQLYERYETIDLPLARTANSHDNASNENHPLDDILAGDLTRGFGHGICFPNGYL